MSRLQTITDRTVLHLLDLLQQMPDEPFFCTAFEATLNKSRQTAKQYCRILTKMKILSFEDKGKRLGYLYSKSMGREEIALMMREISARIAEDKKNKAIAAHNYRKLKTARQAIFRGKAKQENKEKFVPTQVRFGISYPLFDVKKIVKESFASTYQVGQ
jgi:hypothetical protein